MMRLVRRASLLVALSLLTSAATVYAECAWVLWQQTTTGWAGDPSLSPSGATGTQRGCENLLRQLVSRLGSQGRHTTYDAKAGYYARWAAPELRRANDEPLTVVSFQCLPDTVDPRGPKGK